MWNTALCFIMRMHIQISDCGICVQLSTLYPDMKMQAMLYASDTLQFSFSPGETSVHVPASAKFSAVEPDGSLAALFTLDVVRLNACNAE